MENKQDNAQVVKSDSELAKEFMQRYETLCKEYGLQIQVVPVFVARDDGTYSVKLNVGITKFSKGGDQ